MPRASPACSSCPASLIAQLVRRDRALRAELRVFVAHPSGACLGGVPRLVAERWRRHDVVITTYGPCQRRRDALASDALEPSSSSTRRRPSRTPAPGRRARSSRSRARLAHRADRHAGGEPAGRPLVAVRLPLSGPARFAKRTSAAFVKCAGQAGARAATGRCASWSAPYILRRLKTDKRVIADLPDKTEVQRLSAA